MQFTESDRLCIPVPLYHCFGMVMGVLNCVAHGSAMVLSGESFDAATVLQAVSAERCTALYGVPTMFIALLAHPAIVSARMATLRTGVMAGAPCPVDVMTSVIETMNMREITICYGMTETSPVSFQSAVDAELSVRTSTVGNVHPHVEAKVINADGATVHLGEVGELLVRGYSVMPGYWNDPDRTAAVIDDDGWMHTGDLATIDTLGRAKIVGRIKDMIIRGGENIYPAEIEDFLSRHPAVIDVAVFGVPDMRLGEEVCAWITACAPIAEEDVRNFCDGQIAHYKIPKHVRIVDSFPMTVTGKIQKFEMRSTMRSALGRDEIQTA
jgi:fatty-acyl-CoA synthase